MKKILALLLIVAATMSGCMKKDLDDIRKRLTGLEDWQKSVNSDISTLQRLVERIENNDFVTGVTPLADGSGYVIAFVKSDAVTIKHGTSGTAGDTPQIGVKQSEDQRYYWTVRYGDAPAEWLLDEGGNMIRTTGDNGTDGVEATTPQLRINSTTNFWEISADGGKTWTSTGVKAKGETGDALFAKDGVDNTNVDYVELTLADGTTTIRLPRYKMFKIGTDAGNEAIKIYSSYIWLPYDIALSLPSGFSEADFESIIAEVKSSAGTETDIQSRAAMYPWQVRVTKPTFDADGTCNNDAKVTVIVHEDSDDGDMAMLEVTILAKDGSKVTTTRPLRFSVFKIGDYYPDGDNPATAIGMVYRINKYKKHQGMIVALTEIQAQWSTSLLFSGIGANGDDGQMNMSYIETYIKSRNLQWSDFPAFEYCHYFSPSGFADWYLPAINELMALYAVTSGLRMVSYGESANQWNEIYPWGKAPMPDNEKYADAREAFNQKLMAASGVGFTKGEYWSSTGLNSDSSWDLSFSNGMATTNSHKDIPANVRCVKAFRPNYPD